MFTHSLEAPQLITAMLIVIIEGFALLVVWRSRHRSTAAKVLWSAVIVVVPAVGALGLFANHGIGLLTRRVTRPPGY